MNSISVDEISLSFYDSGVEKCIFKDFSYTFKKPGIYAIYGPSGSGKSSLMRLLVGDIHPKSGKVLYGDSEVLFKRGDNSLFVSREFRRMSLSLGEYFSLSLSRETTNPTEAKKIVENAFFDTPVLPLLPKKILSLSSGEKRMAEYFCYRLSKADFFIFDEPFAGVSDTNISIIENDLLKLSASSGVIITIHPKEIQGSFLESCKRIELK